MFQELGDGVFRRRYESLDFNVGVIIGQDGVLIVDTRASHREAKELQADLSRFTGLPVRWVVNTHWHWDHVYGNAMFPDAEIWGHELCLGPLGEGGVDQTASAKKWLPPSQHADLDEVVIVPPQRTFSTSASLAIGRDVELTYHGFGHTDADIIVRVPDSGVAFFGDLIEEGGPPNFGDSHPVAWPLTLRLASDELPPVAVPGHGDVVDAAFIRGQHEELVSVADLATAHVNGEMTLDEAAGSGPYSPEVMKSALVRAQAIA